MIFWYIFLGYIGYFRNLGVLLSSKNDAIVFLIRCLCYPFIIQKCIPVDKKLVRFLMSDDSYKRAFMFFLP